MIAINNYRGQAATIERFFAYACHAVGDGYRSQAAAAIERIITDVGHAVGDGHRVQVCQSKGTISDA